MDLDKRIEDLFREVLELDDEFVVTDQLSIDDIDEWDSLTSMDLNTQLEKEFGIRFSFEEIVEMDHVGAIKKIVRGKINES